MSRKTEITAAYEARVLDSLYTERMGQTIRWLDSVGSTNAIARAWGTDGAREGAVVVSEYQTMGRGRHGRIWDADRGQNLTFSLVLRPPLPIDQLGLITLAASLAVADTVGSFSGSGDVGIKWPNDVILGGMKCCGMLLESVIGKPEESVLVVLGVGLNINQTSFAGELAASATSLCLFAGRPLDRVEILVSLLGRLEQQIDDVYARPDVTLARYESCLLGKGKLVAFLDINSGRAKEGMMTGVSATGALLVRVEDEIITLHAGDVTLQEGP